MPTLRRIAIRTATEGAFASSLEPTDVERLDQVIRWFDGAPRVVPASRFSRYSLRRRQMELQLGEVARSLLANADRAAGGELSVLDELDLDDRGRLAFVGELLLGAVGPLAQTAGWLFHRFTIEPEESDRLRAEWPATGRTDAFLSEVTRLHPTNPRITRAAIADTIVGGEHVPAHTRVVLNVNAINRDPRVYESPERLLLERWLGGRPPKWGYLSFGLGDRRCLGDVFARASLTALLPALAGGRRFELHDVAETTTGRRQLAEMTRATVSVC
jgi:cytochrome P450